MNERLMVSLSRLSPLPAPLGVAVHIRPSDWGLSGIRKAVYLVTSSARVAWAARRVPVLVLVTVGWELPLIRLFRPRRRLVVVDWLMPSHRWLDRLKLIGRVDEFVVIRRADVNTLERRFGVSPNRCRFVHFPAPTVVQNGDSHSADGYIYSAGWAHRDWATLLAALTETGARAVLSTRQTLAAPPWVRCCPLLSPEEGRAYLRDCRAVAISMVDTTLPSGPLVLLDAMAHGKAVIVTDVGGTRDYVTDGLDALVVPPKDASAMALAIRRLDSDPDLVARLGSAAQDRAASLSPDQFWQSVLFGGLDNEGTDAGSSRVGCAEGGNRRAVQGPA